MASKTIKKCRLLKGFLKIHLSHLNYLHLSNTHFEILSNNYSIYFAKTYLKYSNKKELLIKRVKTLFGTVDAVTSTSPNDQRNNYGDLVKPAACDVLPISVGATISLMRMIENVLRLIISGYQFKLRAGF